MRRRTRRRGGCKEGSRTVGQHRADVARWITIVGWKEFFLKVTVEAGPTRPVSLCLLVCVRETLPLSVTARKGRLTFVLSNHADTHSSL